MRGENSPTLAPPLLTPWALGQELVNPRYTIAKATRADVMAPPKKDPTAGPATLGAVAAAAAAGGGALVGVPLVLRGFGLGVGVLLGVWDSDGMVEGVGVTDLLALGAPGELLGLGELLGVGLTRVGQAAAVLARMLY